MPWLVGVAGIDALSSGLSGLAGSANILDPKIAFSLGIVTSIGLIAGSLSDQQFWQRAFAIKKRELRKAFVWGALSFGFVPIVLGLIGFIGASSTYGVSLPAGVDTALVGVMVVSKLLPLWTVFFFVIMLLSALSSTLDSGLNAAAVLTTTDVMKYKPEEHALLLKAEQGASLTYKEQLAKHLIDAKRLSGARTTMVFLTIAGFIIALGVIYIPGFQLQQLWWVFNTVAACVAVPTLLSLFWDRLDPRGGVLGRPHRILHRPSALHHQQPPQQTSLDRGERAVRRGRHAALLPPDAEEEGDCRNGVSIKEYVWSVSMDPPAP